MFPDDVRVIPWATGAAVFYNYRDFQLTNNTEYTFQINVWLSDKALEGELRMNKELSYRYKVVEKKHKFLKQDDQFYRTNEIWRHKIEKSKEEPLLEEKLVVKNFGKVLYTPEFYEEVK